MNLPDGCLSVFSGHLDEDWARYLATTHSYDWPFPGGPYGAYRGWFCKCEALDPQYGAEILAVFEFAKSQNYGWVMFHESGKRHRGLKVHRKLQEGFDPFLFGLWMEREKEDWRRETAEYLQRLKWKDREIEF